jgi:hypothetical protein
MLLSLESTSNRMSRPGTPIDRDRAALARRARRLVEAVTADDVAEIAADLLRLDRLLGRRNRPSEARFRAAIERVNPALPARTA